MKLKVTIEDRVYEVEVEASEPEPEPLPAISYAMHAAAPRVVAGTPPAEPEGDVDEAKVCRSPINGVVVKVVAQVGQNIQEGDTLLVLEAMKMEHTIAAPRAGVVKKILYGAGEQVTEGAELLVLEDA